MALVEPFETPQPIRLTVSDFQALHEAGAFDQHPRAELIDGVIVAMSPQRLPHTITVNEMTWRLWTALERSGSALTALMGATVDMPPFNAPDPDITLTSEPRGDGYVPLASVALLIEVSASTLRYDLGVKNRLYAINGVPEYWVIDVSRREVHQFWLPLEADYGESRVTPLGGELRSATIPDLAIDGTGILP